MKETSFSEAFYVLGYVRRVLAVNYSFNLSANPEEPILFLLPGDVRGTAYCGTPSEINPGKALTENIAAERRSGAAPVPRQNFLRGRNLTSSRAYLPASENARLFIPKQTTAAALKASLSPSPGGISQQPTGNENSYRANRHGAFINEIGKRQS